MVDYDRSGFTVAPCVWPLTFAENIVAIHPPGSNNTITVVHRSENTLIGAIVGRVVGGIALLLGLALAYWCFVYKQKYVKKLVELVAAESHTAADDNCQGKTELSMGVESVQNDMSAYEKAQKQQKNVGDCRDSSHRPGDGRPIRYWE